MSPDSFMIFAAIILVVVAVNQLWTSLLAGYILASRYREQCLTDDGGIQTGAFVIKKNPDGTTVLRPASEVDDGPPLDREVLDPEEYRRREFDYLYNS